MVEFRRKLYKRGSSFETTIPIPMLFSQDLDKKHEVVFRLDKEKNKWYLDFEEFTETETKKLKRKKKWW